MLLIGFISADEALIHALGEQMRHHESWQYAAFRGLEDALAAWSGRLPSVIVWDCETAPAKPDVAAFFARRLEDMRPGCFLFCIGAVPSPFPAALVANKLSRPLRLGYVLAQIQFYQRLLEKTPDVEWPLGPWLFSPRGRQLAAPMGDVIVKLTDKEVSVLEYLYAAQTPVPKDELLAIIWGYEPTIDTHTLETHIYRLRRKIMGEKGKEAEDVFLTEGGGYQINPQWRDAW